MTNPSVGAIRAQINMADAHRKVYQMVQERAALHGYTPPPVGVAHLLMYTVPANKILDGAQRLFIDTYSRYLIIDLLKDVLDFCGFNYYGKEVVEGFGAGLDDDQVEYSDSGRGIYPAGLFNLMTEIHARYENDPKALFLRPGKEGYVITENGLADETDMLRPTYMLEHLIVIAELRKRGIPLSGYVHWTLVDNWEWADGYCPKFGLVAVDRSNPSLPRTPRFSYSLWSSVCRGKIVTHAMRKNAWARVVAASRRNVKHPMCRGEDAFTSLDEPRWVNVIGGSRLPSGKIVDLRFNVRDVDTEKDRMIPVTTDLILKGIQMSQEDPNGFNLLDYMADAIVPAHTPAPTAKGASSSVGASVPHGSASPVEIAAAWSSFTAGFTEGFFGNLDREASPRSNSIWLVFPISAAAAVCVAMLRFYCHGGPAELL
mmetsp:Transcript_10418/g.17482  ORF Transcript_10418/g.17482 Transcript_10418/m.17482 type:complete len:429 (-) Transcript_10418:544-1830(-)